jgi:hypothetical protein
MSFAILEGISDTYPIRPDALSVQRGGLLHLHHLVAFPRLWYVNRCSSKIAISLCCWLHFLLLGSAAGNIYSTDTTYSERFREEDGSERPSHVPISDHPTQSVYGNISISVGP